MSIWVTKIAQVSTQGLRRTAYMRSVVPMNSADEAVAAEVRAALARHKVDIPTVMEALSLGRRSVSLRINGHHPFSVAELIALADLVGCQPADFLTTIPATSLAS